MTTKLTMLLMILCAGMATAAVPTVLNHQGMLTDDAGLPLSGEYFMTFRLYEQAAGGAEIWSETQRVTVTSGVFNVYLGEVASLDPAQFVGQDIWLGVTVEEDGEMAPRLRLGSGLYAFAAEGQASAGVTWYEDADEDGYGNPLVSVTGHAQPDGYVANSADCDDGNPDIHPGATEQCDGVDSDCDGEDANGITGPPCPLQVGVCGGSTQPCGGVLGWLPCGPEQYGPLYEPFEISCDGLDNNCNGDVDETVNCSDANPCTADYCGGELGCINEPLVGEPCDDDNACTANDQCDGTGNCTGQPVNCNDGNACTIDGCDPIVGCIYIDAESGYPCDDGDACTVNDICDGMGNCVGTPIVCDDGNPCTQDYCDPVVGCVYIPYPAGTPCGPGMVCDGMGNCIPE